METEEAWPQVQTRNEETKVNARYSNLGEGETGQVFNGSTFEEKYLV